jgi:hypothetical protein
MLVNNISNKSFIPKLNVNSLSTKNFNVDNSGNILVPLPEEVIKQLFGWLSTNTDLPKKGKKRNYDREAVVNDDDDEDEDFEIAKIMTFLGKTTMILLLKEK